MWRGARLQCCKILPIFLLTFLLNTDADSSNMLQQLATRCRDHVITTPQHSTKHSSTGKQVDKIRCKRSLSSSKSLGKRSTKSMKKEFTRPLRMGKRSSKTNMKSTKEKQKFRIQWRWDKTAGKNKILKSFFPYIHLGI